MEKSTTTQYQSHICHFALDVESIFKNLNFGYLNMFGISCLGFRIYFSSPLYAVRYTSFCPLSSIVLHLSSILYICRNSLQIAPFMQNKLNFRKVKMNVRDFLTVGYDNKTLGERGKNKPNSNTMLVRHQCGGIEAKTSGFYSYILAQGLYNRPITESTW